MAEAMIGIMVDVSGSMKEAYALDRSKDVSVERSHAIITAITNILKREAVHHNRKDLVFTCAFGLEEEPKICDFMSLVEYFANLKRNEPVAYVPLIQLAEMSGVFHAGDWIRKSLSETEARILHSCLRNRPDLTKELLYLIPGRFTTGAFTTGAFFYDLFKNSKRDQTVTEAARNSAAYQRAQKVMKEHIVRLIEHLKPRPIQNASATLDDLLSRRRDFSAETLHQQIDELLDPIEPYIFGGTPMCGALLKVKQVFEREVVSRKILFILSDGQPADGIPLDIVQDRSFQHVTIVTCYLTCDDIRNPKRLLYEADPDWKEKDGRKALFEMSSTMKNTHTPISYLVDAGWELPRAGRSRLFIEANSLDVVDEFCKIVVSQMTQPCDALVDLLEKVHLATYINQTNEQFEPAKQEGGTCYANAIAAVFHLAMNRIVGRQGGIPKFETIRKLIIKNDGLDGASTPMVLEKVCKEYRLHFCETDERGARKAINERRPLVARFSFDREQQKQFAAFYQQEPKGILRRRNLTENTGKLGGHAVVLTGCDPDCLTFMNSWGKDFADGGFFRVEDENVLDGTTFYDIFWTCDDLKESEK